jgi:hypothetical protein
MLNPINPPINLLGLVKQYIYRLFSGAVFYSLLLLKYLHAETEAYPTSGPAWHQYFLCHQLHSG